MRQLWAKYKYRFLVFISVFGPATIAAIADNDAAGVATYSLAGAKFGYSILFILLFVTVLLAITQEMGVRTAAITGKGLGDLIRERHGVRVAFLVFLLLLIANMGSIIANFSALKTVAHMFNLPVIPLVIIVIVAAFLFISKGDYKTNQRIFLFGTILYLSYIISAFKTFPDWGKAITSLVTPVEIKLSKEFIFASIAVLGTTITPWGQFFVNSFVVDKKIQPEKLKYSQLETYFGAFLTDFFSFFMIVATASTLFVHKISLISGEEAALAIRPFAGELASILFGLGLLNAAIMGIIIISLTTSYAFSEFFGFSGSLDDPYERGRFFYTLFLLQLIVAALFVIFPFISLFKIVFFTQSLNAVLLPIIFYFLLKITNNKDLMGSYTNSKDRNYIVIASSVIIIFASIFVLISSIFKL
ncbi:hypothetical protein A3I50_01115 [Candidatus Roizmanbacteria bacterium RIFCSPLOWO2_02_FULL_37_9]|uniref:Mn transporter n=1 Tax=Candidatus Roizmanbacteria bacterium RIFCSPLOWO2_01_FULL_37_16 TaxID=1802058 RepID=A0A1F7IQK3_9BACT|nr:MAG: hypothetical protein A2859_00495 [Candidatus Roizmanbacteria bacterium RIFCSPHIGHO2_01_FULL_37_16b]OGK32729.1 MAG: hypothetical protein A3F57_02005 [Candidatus Roizmanbacteria bacterium RIFCSPHIGHO2_12_FULL_36_11]OGK45641.1 MAG: hypothetical protein A3B40_00430 [Candidatus Roizmanbacteria bacterium RIFCSPLOWO2_01_FULL_37_16]OGK56626.1 MAG: hypothetical protein A3I50_01115 [Candidatus Roizmanbacteria bacterium RIFCSPLOWO2_02_FULL_37_9]